MDAFEYVVVLTSLILGLGIAQLLTGIADVLSNFKNMKLYWPHTLFVLVIFLLHIQEWWVNYEYASIITIWDLKTVLAILAYPILLFVMARMIFPTGIRGNETDFKTYYQDQWKYIFLIGFITVVISVSLNLWISDIDLIHQIPQLAYGLAYLLFVLLNIDNSKAHLVFQIGTFLVWVSYILLDKTTLTPY